MVEKNRLVLWGLETTNVQSTLNLGLAISVMDSTMFVCEQIPTNTLQQWEKICVMYSWVLCERLRRDIRWGITVGS